MHLRLFFNKPASAPDAESVRTHVEQCNDCQTILAGFEIGDGTKNTLADEPMILTQRVTSAADTIPFMPKSEIAAPPGDRGHDPEHAD